MKRSVAPVTTVLGVALAVAAIAILVPGVATAQEGNFTVSNASSNAPISAGETLTVSATVENVGDEDDQNVSLVVGGAVRDRSRLRLASGESTTVELTWETEEGDAGEYTAVVESANDSDSTGATVLEPGTFAVGIDATNDPITEGETLNVTATVENTGETADTRTVTLTVGGVERDRTSVTLEDSETATVELSWATSPGDAGNYTATVATENDSASTDVSVTAPANYSLRIVGTTAPVTAGEALSVTVSVANIGDLPGNETVTLSVGGVERDNRSVTLEPGVSRSIELTWATGAGDAGNYTATVASPNDSASTPVAISSPGDISVTIDATTSPVVEGETLTVTARLQNSGAEAARPAVTLTVGGTVRDTVSVEIGAGDATSVELSWATQAGDAGNYTATVASANDSDSTAVHIEPGGGLDVSLEETNSPVLEGETLSVTAVLRNGGPEEVAERVTLTVGGEVRDSREVVVGPEGSATVALHWATESGDAGNYTATVASPNDSAETDVEISPGARVGISVADPDRVTEGETLTVRVTLANTGEATASRTVRLRIGDVVRDERSVQVPAGERRTVALTWTTGEGDAGNYTATVATANDSAETDVTINAPPTADITRTDVDAETVTFDGTNSSDPDGNITTYVWRVDGEVVGTGPTLRYTFQTAGEHVVTLAVTDDAGANASTVASVTVGDSAPGGDGLPVPGFGVALAVIAALLAVGRLVSRRD